MLKRVLILLCLLLLTPFVPGCSGNPEGEPVRISVRPGASFGEVTDSLASKGIVDFAPAFKIYARVEGTAGKVRPGTYAFQRGTSWGDILEAFRTGRVMTAKLVVPEGWNLVGISERMARITTKESDSILTILMDTAAPAKFDVPGPTLEGYLYPATYEFPLDVHVDSMVSRMVRRYKQAWTPARRALADSIGMTEREVVTLASIVEKEARHLEEMPTIAAVYHNRLERGIALYADPTVQYALGTHRSRLMYSDIDSVADNPYNTYRHRGLPPGPIASPSERGLDAVLRPAKVDYLYFVAREDGTHVFTRTLTEHNRAKAAARRARQSAAPQAQ